MTRVSLSEVWIETRAFLQREGGLVFPLGLATLGVAMLVTSLIVPEPVQGQIPPGPWMIGMVPVLVLFLLGNLALSALALEPGIAVRDAIRAGFVRLPTGLMVFFGLMLDAAAAVMLFSVIAVVIGTGLGWQLQQATALAVIFAVVPLMWASVRLLPVWAVIAQGTQGPMAAARLAFGLTRGRFWRLASLILLYFLFYMLVTSAVQVAGGSVFLLLGRLFGNLDAGRLLTAIAVSLVGAILGSGWTVFVALLSRRLAGGSPVSA